jgi:hypothetical protein
MTCAGPVCLGWPDWALLLMLLTILNHQAGTISGVAAVYQRHEFLAERRAALDLWGAHVVRILRECHEQRIGLKVVA